MRLTGRQLETLKRNNEESNYVTREAIQDALYILMDGKDFKSITITEIINKAGVSRSAFYRNYKTKDDIIKDTMTELFHKIEKEMDSIEVNWGSAFEYLYENKKILDLIVKAHLEYLLLEYINSQLTYDCSSNNYLRAMNHGIAFNVLFYWIKCGMQDSPKEALQKTLLAYSSLDQYIDAQMKLQK